MKLFNSVILFICFHCISTFDSSMYCQRDLRCNIKDNNEDHTACRRKNMNCVPVPGCTKLTLSNDERQAIVDKHNELRNRVANGDELRGWPRDPQPQAANMRVLNYNFELEQIAQCHANECVFEHDKCRRTREFKVVGQNIGFRGVTWRYKFPEYLQSHLRTIQTWYDEVADFSPRSLKEFGGRMGRESKMVEHYTQLVWAAADNIGCARVIYKRNKFNNHMLVCNYGSKEGGGNIEGNPIYEKGPPCTKCPEGLKRNERFPGLCGTDIPIRKAVLKGYRWRRALFNETEGK